MARQQKPASRLSPALMVWGGLSALLLLGALFTALDRGNQIAAEIKRANSNGSRAVLNAASGAVSLTQSSASPKSFDVAEATEAAAPQEEESTAPPPTTEAASTTPDTQTPEPTPAAATGTEDVQAMVALRDTPLATTITLPKDNARALVAAPAPEISETVEGETLPKRGAGNAIPATIYARAFTRNPEQKLLSIVVLDVGMNTQSMALIAALPKTTTLAFSPYAPDAQKRIDLLRSAGFEVWAMLPAMTISYPQEDPGPLGLVASLPPDEITRRLRAVLARTLGAVGLLLPAEETFSKKTVALSPVVAELDARGLRAFSAHRADDPAYDKKIRRADLWLDAVADEALIQQALTKIPEMLEKKSTLVLVTTARPQTLVLLNRWLNAHPLKEPITLAPLSALWLPKEAVEPEAPAEKSGGGGHGGETKKEEKPKSGH